MDKSVAYIARYRNKAIIIKTRGQINRNNRNTKEQRDVEQKRECGTTNFEEVPEREYIPTTVIKKTKKEISEISIANIIESRESKSKNREDKDSK